jgi:type IV secretory pathway VirB6-like protein
MKLLIAALALLSFVATSMLPATVMAQAAAGTTQPAPDQTTTGTPKSTHKATHHKHAKGKKKSSTKKHIKKKPAKKHTTHKKKPKSKTPATSTNPS